MDSTAARVVVQRVIQGAVNSEAAPFGVDEGAVAKGFVWSEGPGEIVDQHSAVHETEPHVSGHFVADAGDGDCAAILHARADLLRGELAEGDELGDSRFDGRGTAQYGDVYFFFGVRLGDRFLQIGGKDVPGVPIEQRAKNFPGGEEEGIEKAAPADRVPNAFMCVVSAGLHGWILASYTGRVNMANYFGTATAGNAARFREQERPSGPDDRRELRR